MTCRTLFGFRPSPPGDHPVCLQGFDDAMEDQSHTDRRDEKADDAGDRVDTLGADPAQNLLRIDQE
jgi:hypothetical protein